MKAKITQLLIMLTLGAFLMGLTEGCHHKDSKTTEERPAQKRLDEATEDF